MGARGLDKALAADERHVGAAALAAEILLRMGEPGPGVALLSAEVRRDVTTERRACCWPRAAYLGDIRAAERSGAAAGRR